MAQNNFKPFATGANANVTAQADYEALAALLTGFQSGKASSAQINKALRQSSTVAAMLAQFIADKSGNDVLDNGNIATIQASLIQALKANAASANPAYYTDTGAANNLIITPSPALTALTDGQLFDVVCAAVNTGPVTLKVNALNAYPVLGSAGALQGGEIGAAKGVIRLIWSATQSAFLLTGQNTTGPVAVAPAVKSNQAPQLSQVLQSANNLSEIAAAGSKAVAAALTNLGIGPVGTQADLLAGTAKKLIDASVLSAVMPSGDVSPAGKVTIPLLINGAITTFYVMWGQTPASTDSGDTVWTVNFPYSFPTVFLSAQVSLRYPGSVDGNCAVYFYNESKSGMTIRQDKYTSVTAGFVAHWLAVGY